MSLTRAYLIKPTSLERKVNDSYPTAPVATFALSRTVCLPASIWEPAAGRGWMSRELELCGCRVLSSDLHEYPDPLVPVETGVDFLNVNGLARCAGGVITNPPYKHDLAQKFAEKAIRDFSFVALLLRLTFAESLKRYQFFTDHPPTMIIFFSGRIACDESYFLTDNPKDQTKGMVSYAWWIWDKRDSIRETLPGTIMRVRWVNINEMLDKWVAEHREHYF